MECMHHTMALAGGADQYLAWLGFDVLERTKQGAELKTAHTRSEL
jgi:threonine/homoserine/homoserine lactone efflux protein